MLSETEYVEETMHLINSDPNNDEKNTSKLKNKDSKSSILKLVILSLSAFGAEFFYTYFDIYALPIELRAKIPIILSTLPGIVGTVIGFFLTPVISNISDRSSLRFGRRRPFLIVLFLITLVSNVLATFGRTIGLSISPGHYLIGQIFIMIGLSVALISGITLLSIVRAYVMDAAEDNMQVLANSLLTCISSLGVITCTTLAGLVLIEHFKITLNTSIIT